MENKASTGCKSKLTVYEGSCKDSEPEILIIGDSIIGSFIPPGAFTSLFSSGQSYWYA